MALYKHNMERKLKESERWLATTLRSIGDAVIATDAKGRVIFMNPVAKALTGWKQEDALGKDLTEVFNLVSEEKVIENLAAKVIQEGIAISLTNHTLIAKDGTETPIDDSTAPIRDDKGNITGAVLVFQDITERKRAEEEREQLILELWDALAKVKTLRGLLPICAHCKKIRDDEGYWNQLEAYIQEHSEVEFTHGICPECTKKLYPTLFKDDETA
jgi:PAS domain S-box-containing protein